MTSHTGVRRKVGDRRSRGTPGLVDSVEDLAATGERRYVPVPPGGDQPASISGFQSGVPFFAPLEPLSGSDDRSLVSSEDFLTPHPKRELDMGPLRRARFVRWRSSMLTSISST